MIAEELADAIRCGDHLPGSRLPPISALIERFGVARETIRAALNLLARDGLVEIRQGHGTVVLNPSCLPLQAIAEPRVGDGTSTVLAGWAYPTGEIAGRLRVKAEAPLVQRVQHKRVRGRLVGIHEHWLPERVANHVHRVIGLDLADRATPHMDVLGLLRQAGIGLTVTNLDVSARAASDAEAKLMDLDPQTPVCVMRRVAYDTAGNPVEARTTVCVEPISVVALAEPAYHHSADWAAPR
ncbi:GntR family transcriptional regulator PhnF [Actinokineospora soli]